MLKAEEAAGAPPGAPRRPRALVLGPTRELTDQLLRVAKALAHHEKFRSVCVNGGAHALTITVIRNSVGATSRTDHDSRRQR